MWINSVLVSLVKCVLPYVLAQGYDVNNSPDGQEESSHMKKHAESHMDHGFTQAQWDYIFTKYADKAAFFIDTFELPENLGTVTNELYGPSVGDPPVLEADAFYTKRGDRAWKSRMVSLPKRPTRFVRVIAGPHTDPCGGCEGKGTLPVETLHHEWKDEMCPECKGTGKGATYDCILYTAYGVATLDVAASPREPGDIRKQMEELHEKRAGLHDMSEEYKTLQAQIIALREKRTESDTFWAQHALAGAP